MKAWYGWAKCCFGKPASINYSCNFVFESRLLKIDVKVDGEFLNRYNCDGIILCSPLGSTAYSLSAGGPIVAQDVKSIIITPVSPHSLSARPIVLKSTSEISITFPMINNRIGIYSDGQSYKSLNSDSIVVIKQSKSFCKLILTDFSDTYYFINDLDVSYLHVFTYSERNNTSAIAFSNSVSKYSAGSLGS